jgi:hypothetical protein
MGLEKSREFSQDIREMKFPVKGSSSESLAGFFCMPTLKMSPKCHYIRRKILNPGPHGGGRLDLGSA